MDEEAPGGGGGHVEGVGFDAVGDEAEEDGGLEGFEFGGVLEEGEAMSSVDLVECVDEDGAFL